MRISNGDKLNLSPSSVKAPWGGNWEISVKFFGAIWLSGDVKGYSKIWRKAAMCRLRLIRSFIV